MKKAYGYGTRAYRNVLPGRTKDTPQRIRIDVQKYGFAKEKDKAMTPQGAEAILRTMIREHNDEMEASRNQTVKDALGHRLKALNVALVGISKLNPGEVTDAAATV